MRSAVCDVTREDQVAAAFAGCAREFGGLDILVANAGIASSAAIEETTVELWRKNHDVLAEGYFLTARERLPADEAAEGRFDCVHWLEEWHRPGGECFRLRISEGRGVASWRAASPWKVPRTVSG